MARHYSTKDFFRQMPNALLARYFRGQGLFEDLDFAAMKEGKPDDLFAAWLSLPEYQCKPMDAEFRDIFEISCEKGFHAIIDEASWQLRHSPEALTDLIETLSALPNHYCRAMITYLDYPQFWKGLPMEEALSRFVSIAICSLKLEFARDTYGESHSGSMFASQWR